MAVSRKSRGRLYTLFYALHIKPFLGFFICNGFSDFQKTCFGFFFRGIGQHRTVRIGIIFLSDVIPDGKGILWVWERIGSHDNLKAFLWRLGFVLCRKLFRIGKHFIYSGVFLGGFCFFGLCLILGFPVPVGFSSHYLG